MEAALARAQLRREQMALPDFRFDDQGELLSTGTQRRPASYVFQCLKSHTHFGVLFAGDISSCHVFAGDVDLDDISVSDDASATTTTLRSEITYSSPWDKGRGANLFKVRRGAGGGGTTC